jgi:hypothetical protein
LKLCFRTQLSDMILAAPGKNDFKAINPIDGPEHFS